VEAMLDISKILVGEYESREHLADEDYIKRDGHKGLVLVWIRFIRMSRLIKDLCEHGD
jgi:hypothetical protein